MHISHAAGVTRYTGEDMPLYEYTCRACQQRLEILQRLGEGPKGLVCPACGRKTLEKQFSTFARRRGRLEPVVRGPRLRARTVHLSDVT